MKFIKEYFWAFLILIFWVVGIIYVIGIIINNFDLDYFINELTILPSMGNTIYYLLLFLWGIPTLYLLSSNTLTKSEIKKKALWIYPSMLLLTIFICMVIYGREKTKRAIGYFISETLEFIILAIIGISFMIFCILMFLLNWNMVFQELKKFIKKISDKK
ncbi:hypothetical protein [Elizabethkingia anophelis]|uniref:hypothetical protein n=1 Tax=Elizabethkingia anophelis TaxID=1117645 RepID=UPI000389F4D5|nr:hypothetical protein [Elizabethkingia anophelis]EQB92806.1 hypothetical protein C874_17985 [Elizabethkingia anophelis 502]